MAKLVLHYPIVSPCLTMSQWPSFERNVAVYSDETSMANISDNDEDSTLPVVTPQAVEEPKVGLIPKLKLSRLHHFLVVKGSL